MILYHTVLEVGSAILSSASDGASLCLYLLVDLVAVPQALIVIGSPPSFPCFFVVMWVRQRVYDH